MGLPTTYACLSRKSWRAHNESSLLPAYHPFSCKCSHSCLRINISREENRGNQYLTCLGSVFCPFIRPRLLMWFTCILKLVSQFSSLCLITIVSIFHFWTADPSSMYYQDWRLNKKLFCKLNSTLLINFGVHCQIS